MANFNDRRAVSVDVNVKLLDVRMGECWYPRINWRNSTSPHRMYDGASWLTSIGGSDFKLAQKVCLRLNDLFRYLGNVMGRVQ